MLRQAPCPSNAGAFPYREVSGTGARMSSSPRSHSFISRNLQWALIDGWALVRIHKEEREEYYKDENICKFTSPNPADKGNETGSFEWNLD